MCRKRVDDSHCAATAACDAAAVAAVDDDDDAADHEATCGSAPRQRAEVDPVEEEVEAERVDAARDERRRGEVSSGEERTWAGVRMQQVGPARGLDDTQRRDDEKSDISCSGRTSKRRTHQATSTAGRRSQCTVSCCHTAASSCIGVTIPVVKT